MVRLRHPIRRFDLFADSHRPDRMQQGRPADEAKGYGLWLAKVVAARKFAKWKIVCVRRWFGLRSQAGFP